MRNVHILRATDAPQVLLQEWMEEAFNRHPHAHPNRHREWALARTCLTLALQAQGITLDPAECDFIDYQQLSALPSWRFSLSHCQDTAGVWLTQTHEIAHPGFDIEYRQRQINDEIEKRLRHPEDIRLDSLELWVVKEAAYKTLPSKIQQDIWLNSLIVREDKFYLKSQATPQGKWSLTPSKDLLVGQAWYEPVSCDRP